MPQKTLYKNLTDNDMNLHFIDGLHNLKSGDTDMYLLWKNKVTGLTFRCMTSSVVVEISNISP